MAAAGACWVDVACQNLVKNTMKKQVILPGYKIIVNTLFNLNLSRLTS